MASNPEETSPKKGVSIINKALPSFGSDKQLEASIGKQVRIAQKMLVLLFNSCQNNLYYPQACFQR